MSSICMTYVHALTCSPLRALYHALSAKKSAKRAISIPSMVCIILYIAFAINCSISVSHSLTLP